MQAAKKARPAHHGNDGGPETEDGYPVDLERSANITVEPAVQVGDRKPAQDLLLEACARYCNLLSQQHSLRKRVRALWAITRYCTDLGASDVVQTEMMQLADEMGLVADLGKHGQQDCERLVASALLGRDPFGSAQ